MKLCNKMLYLKRKNTQLVQPYLEDKFSMRFVFLSSEGNKHMVMKLYINKIICLLLKYFIYKKY